jgi:hypothetical protein
LLLVLEGFLADPSQALGTNRASAARLTALLFARPTLLVSLATLNILSISRGRPLRLGRWDWIIWVPASLVLATVVGIAAATQGAAGWWQVSCVLLTIVTLAISLAFGRLVVAVVRVRRTSRQRHQITRATTPASAKSGQPFLPPLHPSKSFSTSFLLSSARSREQTPTPVVEAAVRESKESDMPRPSLSSEHNVPIGLGLPFAFLANDPHGKPHGGYDTRPVTPDVEPATPRSIAFSERSAFDDDEREPRPSMGSYVRRFSVSSCNVDANGARWETAIDSDSHDNVNRGRSGRRLCQSCQARLER